jgi:PHD/YefM family antitoxin component YafN of YafNO toxin-antitoxin module
MKEMPFTEFRRKISTTLERMMKTGKPLLVTRLGEVLVVIRPITDNATAQG